MQENQNKNKGLFNFNRSQNTLVLLLAVLVLVGVTLMTQGRDDAMGLGVGEVAPATTVSPATAGAEQDQPPAGAPVAEEELFQEELEDILSQISGVGDVAVKVVLAQGRRFEYATDTKEGQTENRDGGAGDAAGRQTSETSQETKVVLARTGGQNDEQPVVVQETGPVVQGVLVVATGAGSPVVKQRIVRAVTTLYNLAPYQVEVVAMGKGGTNRDLN